MALDTEIWAKSLLSGTSAKKLSRESHWPVLGTEQKPVWREQGWQGRERQEVAGQGRQQGHIFMEGHVSPGSELALYPNGNGF